MKFNHCFCFLLLAVLGTVQGDGPPPGPKNQAKCPVTGEDIAIASSTASVQFTHGQKLYFSSENAASLYQKNPRNFWLSPHELPLKGPDGKRGLPDMRNATVVCPSSGENFTVTHCPHSHEIRRFNFLSVFGSDKSGSRVDLNHPSKSTDSNNS